MSDDGRGAEGTSPENRFAVLEVFGLKLEVSNPRIAELLTMDAREALTTDVRDLAGAPSQTSAPVKRSDVDEALPESVIAPVTAHDVEMERQRREFRQVVESMGEALGFEAEADGTWHSPTGVVILTRAIDKTLSLAAASHFVAQVAALRESMEEHESTALFVVDGQQTADIFKVAIRQRKLYDVMRTVSKENLERIAELYRAGVVDHAKAVVLLVPMANIDVGEVLSVITAPECEDAVEDLIPEA